MTECVPEKKIRIKVYSGPYRGQTGTKVGRYGCSGVNVEIDGKIVYIFNEEFREKK